MGASKTVHDAHVRSVLQTIGILAVFCTTGEFTILTPCIATFSHHFADTPTTTIMFANSITGIVSVPISIVSGGLIRKFGFKRAAVLGVLIMSLGGAFPFLMPETTNYLYVIASRVIVGIGLGIMFPVGNATIIAFYEGRKRSRMLGWGVTVQFLFALVYTTAAGFLTEIAWNWSFLAYLIGFIPLIIVILWMPEAKPLVNAHPAEDASDSGRSAHDGAKIPVAVWGYALFALVTWTCVGTVQVITSTVLDARALAGPAVASLVINCCGIGSIVCGLIFAQMVSLLKMRLFGVGALLVALSIVPCLLAQSPVVYAAGVFVLGFGGSLCFTGVQNAAGNITPKSKVPFVSGVLTAIMSLASFIAPYLYAASTVCIPAMGVDAAFPVLIAMGAVCALVGLVHPMKALMWVGE